MCDGTAILTLRRLWVESLWPEGCLSPAGPWAYQIAIRACEPRDRQGSRIWRSHPTGISG